MSLFSSYLSAISNLNHLGNGRQIEWLFHCGMLFSSMNTWWANFGLRPSAHEGIDITYYRTCPEEFCCFDDSVIIPAMADGRILNICNDFLGKTIIVEAGDPESAELQVIFAYAHILPESRLGIGRMIRKNDIIARVCHTRKNPQLPPHLHFSCFELKRGCPPENLNWTLFTKNPAINQIHPVFL